MKRTYKNDSEVKSVLKEALWLAWNAAGNPFGMGMLKNNPTATKEDVWNNATGIGDYCSPTSSPGDLCADYVFGRMIKLSVYYGEDYIDIPDSTLRPDYQAWCKKYKTYEDLFNAAEKVLNK